MKKMNKKGFTIVELVIVIAVIAILAAVMIPTFSGVVTKAKQSAALQEIRAAYTETLANDLSTSDTSDDVVADADEIYVTHTNGTSIKIVDGKAEVVTGTVTVTHNLTDGLLVEVTNP